MTSESAVVRPRRDILDSLWRVGSASTTTVALAWLLAVTLVFAAIFPQVPAGLETAVEQQWFSTAVSSFGRLGPLFQTTGLFSVLRGPWLRVLLTVIAYHLLLRSADQGRHALWCLKRKTLRPDWPEGLSTERITVSGSLDTAQERVEAALSDLYHVQRVKAGPTDAQIYVQQHRFGVLGPLLGCLGPLVILLALAIDGRIGWEVTSVPLAPKSDVVLPQARGLHIGLQDITGADTNAVSTFFLAQPDGSSRTGRVGYARPYHWGNIWVVQRAIGLALAVTAQDAAGHAVKMQSQVDQGEPREALYILFTQSETEQAFAVSGQNLAFRVVSYPSLPEQGINNPVFLVEAYRGDNPSTPILDQLVEDKVTTVIDGVTYSLRRDRHAILEAAYLPGLVPLLAGGLLTLAGVSLALRWRHIQAWIDFTAVGMDQVVLTAAIPPSHSRVELDHLEQVLRRAGDERAD